jgi:nitrogen fixation NifU-like protein
MTEALKGKTEAEAEALFGRFRDMVTTAAAGQAAAAPEMGKLAVLAGVREFPERVKCATLAWHTLHAALHDEERPVSTE